MAKKAVRKKIPKELAIIQADNCTGCESCLEVCPVDCIFMIKQGVTQWCEIDLERCIGCEQCIHIPGKQGRVYDVKVCPWDAIEMVQASLCIINAKPASNRLAVTAGPKCAETEGDC